MWYRRRPFHFAFDIPPFGFYFGAPRWARRREDYVRMLERYRDDLTEELEAVQREIDGLKEQKGG